MSITEALYFVKLIKLFHVLCDTPWLFTWLVSNHKLHVQKFCFCAYHGGEGLFSEEILFPQRNTFPKMGNIAF